MELLTPIRVGSRQAPNRVIFGPRVTNLGDGRSLSPRHVAYYERRARGGTGILVVEEASVHESDWPYERSPLASECGPGWRAIVDACHPHGGLVLAGLGHAGGQGTSHWSQRPLWSPSDEPEVNTREVPKIMEAADVTAVVDGFGRAAAAAVAAGCDGVEVNAGQHSLVRQFLSALTNRRDDDHGTDAGATLVTSTTATGLLQDGGGRVTGVRTDRSDGDLTADVVIACDGVNSFPAKEAGLYPHAGDSTHLTLGAKEVLALPRDVIEDRFGLTGDEGADFEIVGCTGDIAGGGFIYTNLDTVGSGWCSDCPTWPSRTDAPRSSSPD